MVLVHLPGRIPAHVRHRLENTTRRTGSVLLTTGGMGRSSLRLRVTRQSWLGAEYGYGRLRGRLAQMVADGRGTLARPLIRSWLWLPGPDGMVTAANQALSAPAVANYIAKYATKTLTVPGVPDKRIRTAFDLQGLRCSRHYQRMITTAWQLGAHRATGRNGSGNGPTCSATAAASSPNPAATPSPSASSAPPAPTTAALSATRTGNATPGGARSMTSWF